MGKGKKKVKGKKRDGKKTNDDKAVGEGKHVWSVKEKNVWSVKEPTLEQHERAIEAAVNRTEDPLKNWTRVQNEECPICMLPFPHESNDTKYCYTCGTTVCKGCMISAGIVHRKDGGDIKGAMDNFLTCPYCRSNNELYDDKATLEKLMKQANTGNGEALFRVGTHYFDGGMGLKQDKAEGLKWYHRGVEAGSGKAALFLGKCYNEGDGVDKDEEIALEYFQKAAELGYVPAFNLIGAILMNKGFIEEGMLNYRKAAICGMSDDWLFNALRDGFEDGFITKDEYAYALREHQKACNEMKSDAREAWLR